MKLVIFLSLLSVSLGAKICANYREGSFIAHPEKCNRFFQCRPSRAILFDCPEGMLFNSATAACDHSGTVQCSVRPMPIDIEFIPITADEPNVDFANPICFHITTGTVMAHETDCSSFYQCSTAGAIRYHCPAGTKFDHLKKRCDLGDVVVCKNPDVPGIDPEFPLPPQPQYPYPPNIPQPLPEYPPINRPEATPEYPPINRPEATPEYPPNRPFPTPEQPIQRPTPSTTVDPINPNFDLLCSGQKENTKLPNPINCAQYVQCGHSGTAKLFTCPKGTLYNIQKWTCDWPKNVVCYFKAHNLE